jgi:hypothetical protein
MQTPAQAMYAFPPAGVNGQVAVNCGGQLKAARKLLLVIELPDASPGTIAAGATDMLGPAGDAGPAVVLDAAGWRWLRDLVAVLSGWDGRAGDGGVLV